MLNIRWEVNLKKNKWRELRRVRVKVYWKILTFLMENTEEDKNCIGKQKLEYARQIMEYIGWNKYVEMKRLT